MSECLFCRILAGDTAASVVHEDDQALVMLDLYPVRPGHVLIIPKQHVARVEELSAAQLGHLVNLAQRLIRAERAVADSTGGSAPKGHNLLINDGVAAGQHVPHLHLHVIPREGPGDRPALALAWLTRLLGQVRRSARRERLDRMAGLLREHFPSA